MKGRRKTKTGVVVSNKMNKTVVLLTHTMTKHPLYKKYIKKRVRFKAHDGNNSCQVGDTVLVRETRPISKDKRWNVVEVLEKAI